MLSTRTRIAGLAAVAIAVLGLTGCFPDARPGTLDSLSAQVISFEDRLVDVLRSTRVPEAVSRELGPADPVVSDAMSSQVLRNVVDGDTVTIEVGHHTSGFAGGGWISDTSDVYLCLAYVIEPHDGTFTRTESECPGAPNRVAELVTIDELDLENAE